MKRILLVWWMTATAVFAGSPGWLLSYEKALEFAQKSGRPILLNFTGSDWCGWCKRMKAETLTQPEFMKFASSNLILVELDFPQNIPQTPEIRAANASTKQQFAVRGFPTFVMVSAQGEEVGRQVGYLEGGATAFNAKLSQWVEKARANKSTPAPAPAAAAPPAK